MSAYRLGGDTEVERILDVYFYGPKESQSNPPLTDSQTQQLLKCSVVLLSMLIILTLLIIDSTGPLTCALLTLTYPIVDTTKALWEGTNLDQHAATLMIYVVFDCIAYLMPSGKVFRLVKTAVLLAIQHPKYRAAERLLRRWIRWRNGN